MIRRALLSVSNKEGIVEFARGLIDLGVEIISTGGTARLLKESGVPVRSVSEVAGFPEILDGRVKTLQPGIHGGILAVRDNPEHMRQLKEHGIEPIDLVAVNLYPFRETVAKPGVSLDEALENIDIGGPTMVRAAAKNHPDVVILVNPDRYGEVLAELRETGLVSSRTRYRLALEAFRHTAEYDAAIAGYLARGTAGTEAGDPLSFPQRLQLTFEKAQDLRYGENPHQRAAFYRETAPAGANVAGATLTGATVAGARQLHGKELSFNNINDADAALELVKEFDRPAAVAVKHTNPCGVAIGETLAEAYRKAHDADPVSIFGGILACNRPVDDETAREAAKIFLEIIIAPGFTEEALSVFKKKRDLRLLATGPWGGPGADRVSPAGYDLKKVGGGLLVQELDRFDHPRSEWRVVTRKSPDAHHWDDLEFAWKVCKHVKSNAIVVAKGLKTLGVGAGQMNRIDAARHALKRAGEEARGAVLASDAFFPFPDVVEAAAEAGVAVIVQPGGSIRDDDSIRRADELGLAMVFTGVRHFRH